MFIQSSKFRKQGLTNDFMNETNNLHTLSCCFEDEMQSVCNFLLVVYVFCALMDFGLSKAYYNWAMHILLIFMCTILYGLYFIVTPHPEYLYIA